MFPLSGDWTSPSKETMDSFNIYHISYCKCSNILSIVRRMCARPSDVLTIDRSNSQTRAKKYELRKKKNHHRGNSSFCSFITVITSSSMKTGGSSALGVSLTRFRNGWMDNLFCTSQSDWKPFPLLRADEWPVRLLCSPASMKRKKRKNFFFLTV